MGQLRDRMEANLRLQNFRPGTQVEYLRCARKLAEHFMRPPEELTKEDVRGYLLHLLLVRKLSPSPSVPTLTVWRQNRASPETPTQCFQWFSATDLLTWPENA